MSSTMRRTMLLVDNGEFTLDEQPGQAQDTAEGLDVRAQRLELRTRHVAALDLADPGLADAHLLSDFDLGAVLPLAYLRQPVIVAWW
jgi:hypothetical protein